MVEVYVTAVIDSPVDSVWRLIRDFDSLPLWHPMVRTSHIEDGWPSAQVGCVRNFQLSDSGGVIREQLVALSDVEHLCGYTILSSPLAIENYRAEIRLYPVTITNETFGQWRATFDVAAREREEMARLVQSVFEEGFAGVARALRATS